MKTLVAVVLLCTGCALYPEAQKPDVVPELVFRTPLPVVPAEWSASPPKIELLIHISKCGEVTDARFVQATGDDGWESNALMEVRQWRFSPARVGHDSVSVWIRMPVSIKVTDVRLMDLIQLVCTQRAAADSAYHLLLSGNAFETIAGTLAVMDPAIRVRRIGKTDIRSYPETIRTELARLQVHEFTPPLSLGSVFVIFKRLPRNPGVGT